MLEGGGQLFRMSVALGVIFKRKVNIYEIRKNREKKGLSNQHLTGLKSIMGMLPSCNVEGDKVGAKTVKFDSKSNDLDAKSFTADCKSPGAIGLIL